MHTRIHYFLRHFYFVLGLLSLMSLAACNRAQEVRQESYVFGTRVEIVSYGVPEPQARLALAETLREFDRLHHTYHAWQASELTVLNSALEQGKTATVTPEMSDLLVTAQQFSRDSDGLFEPAIGHLIALWGFQNDQFEAQLPDPAQIDKLVAMHPRSTDLQIKAQEVSSRNKAVQFDFGGMVKGYALDRAAHILRQHGVHNALINIGGNVMTLGQKGDQPWTVGIQHPRTAGPLATLALYDGEAIGTSGDYQRFFEVDGKRYSHLIDPRTGWSSQAAQSVTVLIKPADNAGLLSDIISKPLFLAGTDWPAQARKLHVSEVLRVDAQGRIQVSSAMRARLHWAQGIEPAEIIDLKP